MGFGLHFDSSGSGLGWHDFSKINPEHFTSWKNKTIFLNINECICFILYKNDTIYIKNIIMDCLSIIVLKTGFIFYHFGSGFNFRKKFGFLFGITGLVQDSRSENSLTWIVLCT